MGKKETDAPKPDGMQLAWQKRTGNMTTSRFGENSAPVHEKFVLLKMFKKAVFIL